jgi:hypothetical protein
MRIGLVTNFKGRGLECDARLITPLIESAGHTVERLQYDEKHHGNFDLLIFLEVAPRHLVRLSDAPPWIIVNPEFLVPEYISTIRRSFGRVFSKTHEAQRISKGLFGDKAEYIGFLSEDRFDESIERQMTFLHVAGHSKAKGTDAKRSAETPSNRATSSRNGGRNHLGTPSDIKSEWRARSSRNPGRLPSESAVSRSSGG